MQYRKRIMRFTARVLILTFTCQLVFPVISFGLTTGPSQPEVQSFEPVGTTDMVDMFTGDFVYNIPLLDVEGYPVNISYHGGVDMEQEASWVGLGWNINPGAINRTVRGMPDDFMGEQIQKTISIKPDTNYRVGVSAGGEPGGVATPIVNFSASLGGMLNISNYRGVSVDVSASAGVNVFGMLSAGVNMGIGSQSGADIDYNVGLSFGSSNRISSDVAAGVGLHMGHGYNTRTGLKDRSFSVTSSANMGGRNVRGPSYSTTVPIGVKNMIPVITNRSTARSIYGQVKGGVEAAWSFGFGAVSGMVSTLKYETDGSRKGYGYLYTEKADDASILDFTRDRDGMFNKTMHFLPPGNMTYDIYSVTGQGTGGSFRPFRNDIGSVYDPVTSNPPGMDVAVNIDGGLGWTFEFGLDLTVAITNVSSGPWELYKKPFRGNRPGSLFENSYFKQAGELTLTDGAYLAALGGKKPLSGGEAFALPAIKPGSETKRDPRANLIYHFTGADASYYGVASSRKIYSYDTAGGFANGPYFPKDSFDRVSATRKSHHISEVVQVQTDGSRYVYGLPAMNNVQKEVTFAVDPAPPGADRDKGLVSYDTGVHDAVTNDRGLDNFYSATVTPPYAHSYLLTSVLSTDYVDVTGDGVTDDDFGSYTKFNYSLKNADYRWRAPMAGDNKAQYDPGFKSDPMDDKASYLTGSREQWILHSIETKNFIAEFYTAAREDGKGSGAGISGTAYSSSTTPGSSYKLDSIKLYNKHDRFINTTHAVPVKTVIFKYRDFTDTLTLCRGLPYASNGGKLTLERIYVRYGNSDRSMLSPYRFEYSAFNAPYNPAEKDRWGMYKPNNPSFPNVDYPFVNQTDPELDKYAGAWSLKKVHLPSGGTIEVDYEADDYAYVQDKPAMEMFLLKGIGLSDKYMPFSQLHMLPGMPFNYFYFERRKDEERPGASLKDVYLKGQEVMYYNVEARLAGNAYEPIKGYAKVLQVGICSNDDRYGFVFVAPVMPAGGGGFLNPAAYTAINFARYNLPHIVFPGNERDLSNVERILNGLKQSISELFRLSSGPVKQLAEKGVGKDINLAHSYIRLLSPGQKKKGGGHRVKKLEFSDRWADMSADGHTAGYGKHYDYTREENGRRISSGVASYEPQIGGDENPFRMPVPYTAQSGSRWPPNDPVLLYQEMPVGESLYPGPVVGYSRVTVSSIHKDQGRSAQGVDIHEFYTAADFPIEVLHTPLSSKEENTSRFKRQVRKYSAAQGYTIVLNDMHGKPKKIENRVFIPPSDKSELISSVFYKYSTQGNKLHNYVDVLEYDRSVGKMKKVSRQLGVEADVTIDSREKKEETTTNNFYFNLNTSILVFVPIPIPLPIPWEGTYENQFNSVVATKVIQQYGILQEVESFKEGAVTRVRNEVFDAQTGQPVITSVNNEYYDKEYTVNYPAYWGYKNMGPTYENIGYTDTFANMSIDYAGYVLLPRIKWYKEGDELLINYTFNGQRYSNNVWVTLLGWSCAPTVVTDMCGNIVIPAPEDYNYCLACMLAVIPKHANLSNWPVNIGHPNFDPNAKLTDVTVKIVRSGAKNQIGDIIQSYTVLENPIAGNYLNDTLTHLINIEARSFHIADHTKTYRTHEEYNYVKRRKYQSGLLRRDGVFPGNLLWQSIKWDSRCYAPTSEFRASYLRMNPSPDKEWQIVKTVTERSPWGYEIENRDAIGNYSVAMYGYNNQLPVAIAQNAWQPEIVADNFEDYRLLQFFPKSIDFEASPFKRYFTAYSLGGMYGVFGLTGSNNFSITEESAHTGKYALKTGSPASIPVPVPYTECILGYSFTPGDQALTMLKDKSYVVSYWFRPTAPGANMTTYGSVPLGMQRKSNIIDGWQQLEGIIKATDTGTYHLALPENSYVDDIRIYPADANMKSFVYHPFNQKLIATLDENNFATLYEYDQEGNLVRTKRETERGIITISESRSGTVQARP